MSWDLLFQDLPDGLHSMADVPDDFRSPAIVQSCRATGEDLVRLLLK